MTARFAAQGATKQSRRRAARAKRQAAEDAADEAFLVPRGREPGDLWAAAEDWVRGGVPDNGAIIDALSALQTRIAAIGRACDAPPSKEAADALARLVGCAQRAVAERNGDGLLQRLVGHVRLAVQNAAAGAAQRAVSRVPVPGAPATLFGRMQWDARREAKEVAHETWRILSDAKSLLSVGQLLLTSAPFVASLASLGGLLSRVIEVEHERPVPARDSKPTIEIHAPGGWKKAHGQGVYADDTYAHSYGYGEEEPDDNINAILQDAKAVFAALQGSAGHRDALRALWRVAAAASAPHSAEAAAVERVAAAAAADANVAAARSDLVELLRRFAGGHAPTDALAAIHDAWGAAAPPAGLAAHKVAGEDSVPPPPPGRDDAYALADLLADWGTFYARCASDAGYVQSDEYVRRGAALIRRTRDRRTAQIRKAIEAALQTGRAFVAAWTKDPLTKEASNALSHIAAALPRLATDPRVKRDVRDALVPALLAAATAAPLPHIEAVSAYGVRVALDGLALPPELVRPRRVTLATAGTLRQSDAAASSRPAWRSVVRLRADGIAGSLVGLRFAAVRRAWPSWRDRGLVDVSLGGRRGIALALDVETRPGTPLPTLVARSAAADVQRVRLAFRGVRHRRVLALLRPLLQRRIRRGVERGLVARLVQGVRAANAALSALSQAVL